MPVMVLYKDKKIPAEIADDISSELARITDEMLKGKIEVRTIEPVGSYNANPIHLEMRFRDFAEWPDSELEKYHKSVMELIGRILEKKEIACAYSFYIIPSMPPRSKWAQAESKSEKS